MSQQMLAYATALAAFATVVLVLLAAAAPLVNATVARLP